MRYLTLIVLCVSLPVVAICAPFVAKLSGDPAIRVPLDRTYEVFEVSQKKGAPKKNLRMFMFSPTDGQSSAVLGLGSDISRTDEKSIAEMFEGAKVTKRKGRVAGKDSEWWDYRDSQHLYSDCSLTLLDSKGREVLVTIKLIANTPERLHALEDGFSQIELL